MTRQQMFEALAPAPTQAYDVSVKLADRDDAPDREVAEFVRAATAVALVVLSDPCVALRHRGSLVKLDAALTLYADGLVTEIESQVTQ